MSKISKSKLNNSKPTEIQKENQRIKKQENYQVEEKKQQNTKNLFFILVFLSFIAIYIYNRLTPLMSDDLLLTEKYYYENHKFEKWMYSGISGMVIGFLFMILAPGNQVRGALMKAGEEL